MSRMPRWVAAVVAGTALLGLLPGAGTAVATPAALSGSAGSQTCDTTPVTYRGRTWCPGYVFAVTRGIYPVGTRLVLRGVLVDGVNGRAVDVSGGPSCFPDEYCGQITPRMSVTFRERAPLPAYGNVIWLYGRITTAGFAAAGFTVVGQCDPVFGC